MKPVITLIALSCALPASADPSDILDVRLRPDGDTWKVEVTLAHPDTGWDHYADGWRVEDATGQVLGLRELLHPHVTEQPFMRSLSGVIIPEGTAQVFIRTRCSVDGWDFLTKTVDLPQG